MGAAFAYSMRKYRFWVWMSECKIKQRTCYLQATKFCVIKRA